jgi:hypothetical protein
MFDTEPWASPAATKSWTLMGGDGEKTLYYQIRDMAGNTAVFSDSIMLETSPPTGSIQIDAGAVTTDSTAVTLTVSASDPESLVTGMRFSNDATSWSDWESYSTTKAWTLTEGDGTKTVYAQFGNGAGLISDTYLDRIELDTSAPRPYYDLTVRIEGGASPVTGESLALVTLSSTFTEFRLDNTFLDTFEYLEDTMVTVWGGPGNSGFTGTAAFEYWILDGAIAGSDSSIDVVMDSDHELTAVFTILYNPWFGPSDFDVVIDDTTYVVEIASNSTVADFHFNPPPLNNFRFDVTGESGTSGVCNVTVPVELMSGVFEVYLGETLLTEGVDYTQTNNGTHYLFSINYPHSTHTIIITATNVIPEFPSWTLIPTAFLATVIIRKRLKKG